MRIEQHIGRQIHQVRESRGLTLVELGKSLEPWTGRQWSAQAVWQAENGKRDFKASHLVAFALALDVTVSYLIAPPTEGVEIGDGVQLDLEQVERLFGASVALPHQYSRLISVVGQVTHARRELEKLRKQQEAVAEVLAVLHATTIELVSAPETAEEWASYGVGEPDADGMYANYRSVPGGLKPRRPLASKQPETEER